VFAIAFDFHHGLIFTIKAGAYHSVALKALHKARRVYSTELITAVKSFILQAPCCSSHRSNREHFKRENYFRRCYKTFLRRLFIFRRFYSHDTFSSSSQTTGLNKLDRLFLARLLTIVYADIGNDISTKPDCTSLKNILNI
jgi:hypothetical protein